MIEIDTTEATQACTKVEVGGELEDPAEQTSLDGMRWQAGDMFGATPPACLAPHGLVHAKRSKFRLITSGRAAEVEVGTG